MSEKVSIRKTRRLRPLLARAYQLPEPPDKVDSLVDQVAMAVLCVDATPAKAQQAVAKLAEEFLDWNEMRVTMTPEIGVVLESCGLPASRAIALKRILGRAVEELYGFEFESLGKRSRQDLRAWFTGIEGVPHAVAAGVLYWVYAYDRVLVDPEIARVVQRLGLVAPTAIEAEIEAGLADVIPAKEAQLIYHALRQHALTVCTAKDFDCRNCLLRKECETSHTRIAELEAAAREARRKAKAKVKADALAKVKAAADARAKVRADAKAAKEKTKADARAARAKAKAKAKAKAEAEAKRKASDKAKAKTKSKADTKAKAARKPVPRKPAGTS